VSISISMRVMMLTSVGKGDKEAILNQVKSNAMSGADMYAGGVTKMVEEYNA